MAEAVAVAQIIEVAKAGGAVAWMQNGKVRRGVARHIVCSASDFNFLNSSENVFDGYLRVTTDTGFDAAHAISDIVPRLNKDWFIIKSK